MKKLSLSLLMALAASTSSLTFAHDDHKHNPQDEFFNTVSSHCGKTYQGDSVFPADPGPDFKDKKLTMTIAACSETEIRIPFQVGNDTSRTWILTKTAKGLLFKHDHRHPDGTPDEVTMYGGYATKKGSALQQYFPADSETATMLPKAATNVWSMTFNPDDNTFTYYLERHQKARYKAIINLTK